MNVPLYYTMQQCEVVTIENAVMPYIKSLNSCMNRMVGNGYTDSFQPTIKGLYSKKTNKVYQPREIRIVDLFRFEGNVDPADDVVLYTIETSDGCKGTLVNAYGSANETVFSGLFNPLSCSNE